MKEMPKYDRVILETGQLVPIRPLDITPCLKCDGTQTCTLIAEDAFSGQAYFYNEIAYYLEEGEVITPILLEDALGIHWERVYHE